MNTDFECLKGPNGFKNVEIMLQGLKNDEDARWFIEMLNNATNVAQDEAQNYDKTFVYRCKDGTDHMDPPDGVPRQNDGQYYIPLEDDHQGTYSTDHVVIDPVVRAEQPHDSRTVETTDVFEGKQATLLPRRSSTVGDINVDMMFESSVSHTIQKPPHQQPPLFPVHTYVVTPANIPPYQQGGRLPSMNTSSSPGPGTKRVSYQKSTYGWNGTRRQTVSPSPSQYVLTNRTRTEVIGEEGPTVRQHLQQQQKQLLQQQMAIERQREIEQQQLMRRDMTLTDGVPVSAEGVVGSSSSDNCCTQTVSTSITTPSSSTSIPQVTTYSMITSTAGSSEYEFKKSPPKRQRNRTKADGTSARTSRQRKPSQSRTPTQVIVTAAPTHIVSSSDVDDSGDKISNKCSPEQQTTSSNGRNSEHLDSVDTLDKKTVGQTGEEHLFKVPTVSPRKKRERRLTQSGQRLQPIHKVQTVHVPSSSSSQSLGQKGHRVILDPVLLQSQVHESQYSHEIENDAQRMVNIESHMQDGRRNPITDVLHQQNEQLDEFYYQQANQLNIPLNIEEQFFDQPAQFISNVVQKKDPTQTFDMDQDELFKADHTIDLDPYLRGVFEEPAEEKNDPFLGRGSGDEEDEMKPDLKTEKSANCKSSQKSPTGVRLMDWLYDESGELDVPDDDEEFAKLFDGLENDEEGLLHLSNEFPQDLLNEFMGVGSGHGETPEKSRSVDEKDKLEGLTRLDKHTKLERERQVVDRQERQPERQRIGEIQDMIEKQQWERHLSEQGCHPPDPLSTDCVVVDDAVLPPTAPPPGPISMQQYLNDQYTVLAQCGYEQMPPLSPGSHAIYIEKLQAAQEREEELVYERKLFFLKNNMRSLAYTNAALVDEISRLTQRVTVTTEERKILSRRLCHHFRNYIRRLQTAKKRKTDAARRAQEMLTQAETQANVAQIKAKMAKQETKIPQLFPSIPNRDMNMVDIAAIKRNIEASHNALSSTKIRKGRKPGKSPRIPGKTPAKRGRKKQTISPRVIGNNKSVDSSTSYKRFRRESSCTPGTTATTSLIDYPLTEPPSTRKSARMSGQPADSLELPRRIVRVSTQSSNALENVILLDDHDSSSKEIIKQEQNLSETNVDVKSDLSSRSNQEEDAVAVARRRAGRPPARAASAAACSLVAIETCSEDPPVKTRRGRARSRSNINEGQTRISGRRRGRNLSLEIRSTGVEGNQKLLSTLSQQSNILHKIETSDEYQEEVLDDYNDLSLDPTDNDEFFDPMEGHKKRSGRQSPVVCEDIISRCATPVEHKEGATPSRRGRQISRGGRKTPLSRSATPQFADDTIDLSDDDCPYEPSSKRSRTKRSVTIPTERKSVRERKQSLQSTSSTPARTSLSREAKRRS